MDLAQLATVIRSNRYRYRDEKELQEGLEGAFRRAGLRVEREFHLGQGDVPDFLVEEDVAVEVKVDGSLSAVTRQLHRYSQHPRVAALMLVTTRWRLANQPESMTGKPVKVVVLLGGLG